jgi:hypothetical protein
MAVVKFSGCGAGHLWPLRRKALTQRRRRRGAEVGPGVRGDVRSVVLAREIRGLAGRLGRGKNRGYAFCEVSDRVGRE